MCYAVPAKIIEIKKEQATVDYGGIIKKTNISLINTPKIGDYVLIHAGFAIEKLNKKTAEESIKIIKKQIELTDKKNKENQPQKD